MEQIFISNIELIRIIKQISTEIDISGKKVLDIACGKGAISYNFAKENLCFVEGLDLSSENIKSAASEYQLNNLEFYCEDYYDRTDRYDAIISFMSFSKILEKRGITALANKLNDLLVTYGYFIICEESDDEVLKVFEKFNTNHFSLVKTLVFDNNPLRVMIFQKNNSLNKYLMSIKSIKQPLLLYDTKRIIEVIKKHESLKEKYNVLFAFPVKAFPQKKVLRLFAENDFGFDISNQAEYDLIKDYITKDTIITHSSPNGTTITGSKKVIKIDNVPKENYKNARINLNEYGLKFSRFGIDYNKKLKDAETIHIHTVDLKDNKEVLDKITRAIKDISKLCKNLQIINLGGTWEDISYLDFHLFIKEIRTFLNHKVKIIFEPGTLWCWKSGYLISKVLDINEGKTKKVIYLNSSYELHAKWSSPKVYYNKKYKPANKPVLYSGVTCYEKDDFLEDNVEMDLKANDIVIFHNIDGYSYAWNMEFNGIKKAQVKIQ